MVTFTTPGHDAEHDRVVVDFDEVRGARDRALGDRDRRRRAAVRGRVPSQGDEVVGARRLAGAAGAAQGHQRDVRAAGAAGDHREGRRRPCAGRRARRRLHRAVVRALGGGHRAAALAGERVRLDAPGWSRRSRRSRPTRRSTRSSRVTDGLMVARGDYGVEAGVARVPLMQKDTIRRATQDGKFVITATQMLESMIQAPEPTRAEATDVANAVIDGTSAVMLSAETSVGAYPVEAVRAMAEIALAAEEYPGDPRPRRADDHRHDRRGRDARGGRAGRRARRRGADRPELHGRRGAGVREVPPPAADHRARPPARGRRAAHARVGRVPDEHGRRRTPSTR